ncbi:hypothetical protein HDU76_003361 [Blyttiomyces sp. JEL0837]|nr:hypothetical protein HDU76_003361 [Blyttiomyces sp. JEL0837]
MSSYSSSYLSSVGIGTISSTNNATATNTSTTTTPTNKADIVKQRNREAQRAHRERVSKRIASLEGEVASLRSQVERLEEENRSLRAGAAVTTNTSTTKSTTPTDNKGIAAAGNDDTDREWDRTSSKAVAAEKPLSCMSTDVASIAVVPMSSNRNSQNMSEPPHLQWHQHHYRPLAPAPTITPTSGTCSTSTTIATGSTAQLEDKEDKRTEAAAIALVGIAGTADQDMAISEVCGKRKRSPPLTSTCMTPPHSIHDQSCKKPCSTKAKSQSCGSDSPIASCGDDKVARTCCPSSSSTCRTTCGDQQSGSNPTPLPVPLPPPVLPPMMNSAPFTSSGSVFLPPPSQLARPYHRPISHHDSSNPVSELDSRESFAHHPITPPHIAHHHQQQHHDQQSTYSYHPSGGYVDYSDRHRYPSQSHHQHHLLPPPSTSHHPDPRHQHHYDYTSSHAHESQPPPYLNPHRPAEQGQHHPQRHHYTPPGSDLPPYHHQLHPHHHPQQQQQQPHSTWHSYSSRTSIHPPHPHPHAHPQRSAPPTHYQYQQQQQSQSQFQKPAFVDREMPMQTALRCAETVPCCAPDVKDKVITMGMEGQDVSKIRSLCYDVMESAKCVEGGDPNDPRSWKVPREVVEKYGD